MKVPCRPAIEQVFASSMTFVPGAGDVPAVEALVSPEEGLWLSQIHGGTAGIARHCSTHLGGQWWAGDGMVVWVNGATLTYLLELSRYTEALDGRALLAELGCPARSWSLGGLARSALSWIGPPHPYRRCSEDLLATDVVGYRRCAPGKYPNACLMDMRAAYYQGLARLPSPRLTWLQTGPIWHPLATDEQARWDRLVPALASHKGLRNVLVGCMLGSQGQACCYHRGNPLPMRRRFGPFRAAALAIARACYELTWEQAEEHQAPYANTDSLITSNGTVAGVWKRYGYNYRVEAQGDAEVCALGIYAVGSFATYWHSIGSRKVIVHPPDPAPVSLTYRAWH